VSSKKIDDGAKLIAIDGHSYTIQSTLITFLTNGLQHKMFTTDIFK
jgi:hypothetical protein